MFNFAVGDVIKFRRTERTTAVHLFWYGPEKVFTIYRVVHSELTGREYFYFAEFLEAFYDEDLEHV